MSVVRSKAGGHSRAGSGTRWRKNRNQSALRKWEPAKRVAKKGNISLFLKKIICLQGFKTMLNSTEYEI